MPKAFATEKNAFGVCDRCGFRYPLRALRAERHNRSPQGNRVCPECWDDDHPQNYTDLVNIAENFGLRDPRPQTDLADSRDGGDHVWKFTDSLESWTYSDTFGLTVGTMTHNSADGYAYVDLDGGQNPQMSLAGLSISADNFYEVSVRMRVDLEPDGSFFGRLNFTQGGFSHPVDSLNSPEVVQMGEKSTHFTDLRFDVRSDDDWTGTVTNISFVPYTTSHAGGNITTKFSVDEIRVRKVGS